ncbi:flagellar filament capping protein FliD [Clostridioides difficile]
MTTINSNRITGLATGMDIDEMVTNMLTGEQSKIDKADQKKQTQNWQQEIYRGVIKEVKGLYDKYFSITSADSILSSKTFSTMTINSSNNNVITATAGAGASSINYQFTVTKVAEGAKIESSNSNINKSTEISTLNLSSTSIKINDKEIDISEAKTVGDVISTINKNFSNGEIKASYSEMTGKITIETSKTGSEQKLKLEGEFFDSIGIDTSTEVWGKNSIVNVFDTSGNSIKTLENQSNSFAIDGINYSVKGVSIEKVSMTSTQNTKHTVDKMKAFLDDYNKMMDSIYSLVTEKKNNDYPPLTEAQKEEMSEEEIEKWEKKAKTGILRNDNELRRFMDDIKSSLLGEVEGLGITLSDIGIEANSDYNKPGQLVLNEDKFKADLEENGDLVYKAVTTKFEKIKTVTYSYAGSSSSVFAKKAGIEKTATAVNNLFSEQIKKQEEYIKKLTNKMQEKQEKLYLKFANLESSMNSLNSQMNYLVSSLS